MAMSKRKLIGHFFLLVVGSYCISSTAREIWGVETWDKSFWKNSKHLFWKKIIISRLNNLYQMLAISFLVELSIAFPLACFKIKIGTTHSYSSNSSNSPYNLCSKKTRLENHATHALRHRSIKDNKSMLKLTLTTEIRKWKSIKNARINNINNMITVTYIYPYSSTETLTAWKHVFLHIASFHHTVVESVLIIGL